MTKKSSKSIRKGNWVIGLWRECAYKVHSVKRSGDIQIIYNGVPHISMVYQGGFYPRKELKKIKFGLKKYRFVN